MKIKGLVLGGLAVVSLLMVSCNSVDSFKEGVEEGYNKVIEENGTKYQTQGSELLDVTENKDKKEVVVKLRCNGKLLEGNVVSDKDLLIGSTMEDIKKLALSVDTTKFDTLNIWTVNKENEKILSVAVNKDILEKIQSKDLKYADDLKNEVKDELWTK